MDYDSLWRFLPFGYALTVAIELPVLLLGLSPQHAWPRRLFAAVWLTACSYPIVVLALPPLLIGPYGWWVYFAIAELFAVASECLLFWLAFSRSEEGVGGRDLAAVVAANVCSMSAGLLLSNYLWR